jgi:hypothetical protein
MRSCARGCSLTCSLASKYIPYADKHVHVHADTTKHAQIQHKLAHSTLTHACKKRPWSHLPFDEVEGRLKRPRCGEDIRVHERQQPVQLHHAVLQRRACTSREASARQIIAVNREFGLGSEHDMFSCSTAVQIADYGTHRYASRNPAQLYNVPTECISVTQYQPH